MRSDNDTWDITTSVGSTALFVAAARALEAQKPDPLAVDPFAEVFCRAVGGPWAAVLDGEAPDHPLKTPEFGQHFVTFQAARTRYFDAYFRAAAQAGVRQIVLLAAGLDSRAYRLDWSPGTTVYELDQPQVLEFKRETLAAHGATAKAERKEIAIDLRDDWAQALRDSGFRSHEPSAWIAEGLLIYLPASAQEQLFTGIDTLAAPGSHAAVEEGRPMDRDAFREKVDEAKASDDERGQWWQLVYNEQHAPAAQWFAERGWTAQDTTLIDYLETVGRSVESADADAANMLSSITLVSAIKG
ncbi:class I SAM-dependent methyltransferase [Mycolicibacterium aichiense]|uniref:S-adenosyl-L-methionine-dependent methyltransferase n=1 Tax=Mycolicibacterium aichiense TaxID=1799 RepID=A0AAD1HSY7_9MYCO|nr:class I SAM-dependent methyltransferase [Mycolicibacterium aichiense]MCV7017168.1 class I SAM-dependent methyltransferase [Mycolicibacterium aichiense]BBX10404.1 putative S-adenosyl-L-methionine-dependent methyltransferase [Mycolicibacterium aichiense]STZ25938.1 methyltransferase, putative, family protein [Mycolicibacterium aichiense]